jgi:hypothetical protein
MFGIKLKLMKWIFEMTYFYDLLTYLMTVRAKVVMFRIKPKLMKWTFELTYLKTIRAEVVMFGIKPKLMKCRFELTHFYDILTYFMYLKYVRGMPTTRRYMTK